MLIEIKVLLLFILACVLFSFTAMHVFVNVSGSVISPFKRCRVIIAGLVTSRGKNLLSSHAGHMGADASLQLATIHQEQEDP